MTTQLSDAQNTAWKFFLIANVLVLERVEQDLAEAELPPLSWYSVLWSLERSPDQRMRLHELAQEVLLSRSNITRLLDRLEAEELICRERCPSDRRGAFAVITDKGLALRTKMWTVYSQGIEKYFGSYLTDKEVTTITQALERVVTGIKQG